MPEQTQKTKTKTEQETAELEYKDQRNEELLEETDELLGDIDSLLDEIDEEDVDETAMLIVVGSERRVDLSMAFGGCGICHLRPGCPLNGAYVEAIASAS